MAIDYTKIIGDATNPQLRPQNIEKEESTSEQIRNQLIVAHEGWSQQGFTKHFLQCLANRHLECIQAAKRYAKLGSAESAAISLIEAEAIEKIMAYATTGNEKKLTHVDSQ